MKNSRERTRQTWADMKQRCSNPQCHNFKNYGARGISVCDRWVESFENFVSDMGERPEGLTIDRIDTNGNYEPSNCRWADRSQQRRNQRDCVFIECDGLRLTAEEWARKTGLNRCSITYRKKIGMSDYDIIHTPARAGVKISTRTAAMKGAL